MNETTQPRALRRLYDLKSRLFAADRLADQVRDHARKDYSSDDPYENAMALSGRLGACIAAVELMIEDMEAGR